MDDMDSRTNAVLRPACGSDVDAALSVGDRREAGGFPRTAWNGDSRVGELRGLDRVGFAVRIIWCASNEGDACRDWRKNNCFLHPAFFRFSVAR